MKRAGAKENRFRNNRKVNNQIFGLLSSICCRSVALNTNPLYLIDRIFHLPMALPTPVFGMIDDSIPIAFLMHDGCNCFFSI